MRCLVVILVVIGLANSTVLAAAAPRRHVQARLTQPSETVAKLCRAAYNYVQGKGRDVKAFTYFDECLRRGGRL